MANDHIKKILFWRAVPQWLAVGAAAIVLAALIWVNVARADQYGFTSAPYSCDEEYHGCVWPDNGDGPGYEEDRKYCREHARELLLTK
jgi:hypothetical protein